MSDNAAPAPSPNRAMRRAHQKANAPRAVRLGTASRRLPAFYAQTAARREMAALQSGEPDALRRALSRTEASILRLGREARRAARRGERDKVQSAITAINEASDLAIRIREAIATADAPPAP